MAAPLSFVFATQARSTLAVLRHPAIWIVPACLSFSLALCGCDTSPAARHKVKEERWKKGRVFAEIRILEQRRRILPGEAGDRGQAFETFRQTQARMMTSPFVLQAALRKPDVSACSLLKSQENPLEWLEKNLEITIPATEFIRISMKTDDREDAAKIINAVVTAYLDEVGDLEQKRWKSRIMQLERAREELLARRKTKSQRLRRLVEEVGATSDTALSQSELAMVEFYGLIRSELAREEFARARDEIDLKILKRATAERPDSAENQASLPAESASLDTAAINRLEESLKDRGDRIAEWRRQLEVHTVGRKSSAVHSLELQALEHEIEKDQELLDLINEQIARAELEGEPEGQITLFRKADAVGAE